MTTEPSTPDTAAVEPQPAAVTPPPAVEAENAEKESPVALDLDALEREDARGPFPFRHAGRRYLLSDPQDIDWQQLLIAQRDPVYFITLALPADDREAFFGTKMPSWKMNKLVEAYAKHYGLPNAGEAAGSPA